MIVNYSDQEVLKNQKSIFLAGPTPRGENVESWRTKACNIIEQLGFDGIVYVPEYSTWKPMIHPLGRAGLANTRSFHFRHLRAPATKVFLFQSGLRGSES